MTVLTLRPNGDNAYSQQLSPTPSGTHYTCIDEVTEDTSNYVQVVNTVSALVDSYNIQDHTSQSGTISGVVVKAQMSEVSAGSAYLGIRVNSTDYYGSLHTLTTSDALYSDSWANNPNTSAAWSWSDIDALIGLLKMNVPGSKDSATCYQYWIEVTFTPSWQYIAKVNGVAGVAINKVNGLLVANMAKINGVSK